MVFLVFFGVLVLGALVILGVIYAMRPSGPVTPVVLITSVKGEAEAMLIMQRLRDAGIWGRLQVDRMPLVQGSGVAMSAWTYLAEVWVKQEDEDEARSVLGLNRRRDSREDEDAS